jgi:hypothetical protein
MRRLIITVAVLLLISAAVGRLPGMGVVHPGGGKRRSTSPASSPTVSTGASKHHSGPPRRSPKRRPGGPLTYRNPLTLSSHTKRATHPQLPTTTITPNDATPPLHDHQQ